MPVELSNLLGNERWVEVEVNGNLFHVAYRPGNTSLKKQAQLQKKMRQLQTQENADEEEQVMEIGKVFCEMVSNWDLTSGGQPLPITPEVVAGVLPDAVYTAIMEAVAADGKVNANEKKASNATYAASLAQEDRLATAQNGIPSSERRGTWA